MIYCILYSFFITWVLVRHREMPSSVRSSVDILHRDLKSLKLSFISAAWEAAFDESCFLIRTLMSEGPEYVTAFGSPKSFSFISKPAFTYGMSLCFWALAQLCCGSVISYSKFVEIEACLFAIVIPRGIRALSSYLIFSSHLISPYVIS